MLTLATLTSGSDFHCYTNRAFEQAVLVMHTVHYACDVNLSSSLPLHPRLQPQSPSHSHTNVQDEHHTVSNRLPIHPRQASHPNKPPKTNFQQVDRTAALDRPHPRHQPTQLQDRRARRRTVRNSSLQCLLPNHRLHLAKRLKPGPCAAAWEFRGFRPRHFGAAEDGQPGHKARGLQLRARRH
jgi:hypothetical protein